MHVFIILSVKQLVLVGLLSKLWILKKKSATMVYNKNSLVFLRFTHFINLFRLYIH